MKALKTAARGPTLGNKNWSRVPIVAIESWRHAFPNSELEAAQLSGKVPSGSLLLADCNAISFSTGIIEGDISLLGSISETEITLGINLCCPPQTLQWLHEVQSGATCVWLAGDVCDAIYRSGSIFFAVSLSMERLEETAAGLGLVLDAAQLGETRISARPLNPRGLAMLKGACDRLHASEGAIVSAPIDIGELALEMLIEHYARKPRFLVGMSETASFTRIVDRARSYIVEHLDTPISIAELSRASFTSRRTLYRAFEELLGETPQSYVRNLRLNRIRRDLASSRAWDATVTEIATRWGVNEFGRLAGEYRKLFGEFPSDTLRKSGTSRIADQSSTVDISDDQGAASE